MESLKASEESDNDTGLIKATSKEQSQDIGKGHKQRKENYFHIKSERENKHMNLL